MILNQYKMERQLSITILCFLGLFVIVQGLTLKPEDLEQYYKCWTYTNCFSDGPPGQKVENCIQNILKPEEIKSFFKFIEDNYYKYKSDDIPGAVKEYCNDDDDTRHDAYDKTLNGVLAYEKKVCADGDKADLCSRVGQTIGCIFLYLDQLKQQDKCKIDG